MNLTFPGCLYSLTFFRDTQLEKLVLLIPSTDAFCSIVFNLPEAYLCGHRNYFCHNGAQLLIHLVEPRK